MYKSRQNQNLKLNNKNQVRIFLEQIESLNANQHNATNKKNNEFNIC